MAGYMRGTVTTGTNSREGRKGRTSSGGKYAKREGGNARKSQMDFNGAQVQNVKAARVYVFGNDNVTEDDENVEFEMPEMRSRLKGLSPFSKPEEDQPEFFEREIAEGETLQAIALKYACPVSELKRLNNLIQDQEFYALKVVKVPMKKYGILSEQFANRNQDSKHSQHSKAVNGAALTVDSDVESTINYYDESDSQHDFSDPDTQMKVLRTLSIRDNLSSQGREAEKFLLKMDADLTKFKQSSKPERESLSEVISVLTNKSIHPLQSQRANDKHNGATCGISWWSILIISLIIGICAPIIVFLYIKFVMS